MNVARHLCGSGKALHLNRYHHETQNAHTSIIAQVHGLLVVLCEMQSIL